MWHWQDVRPQAIRAAELVGTEQAKRRVLILANPGLPFGGHQYLDGQYPGGDAWGDDPRAASAGRDCG